ncbi:polysaccharide deacetylase family protein [Arthrobacter antibioticus]|uniref:polysaccharide deacetylase family protein n=1 Tax=Arthrobacter sp. H35-MC1 TaxID=3046203 RepID=UPI0024BBB0FE|nr:polysaccharide deacetylase family protein [Arthrobacter sp. H35-MC1]MDJ0316817.1 polysaccharide deacetylase family protein [Arthrobacter sp. H35-MC1]
MPRHLHQSRRLNRVIGSLSIAFVLFLAAVGVWYVLTTSANSTAASPAAALSPAPTPARETPWAPARASTPSAPVPTPDASPATGHADTLDGLIPDYVLPPIENGMVPVLTKIPTAQKVVFLTLDDGAVRRDSDLLLLEEERIKASLFLAHTFIASDPAFYHKYMAGGHLVENHSMSHNLGFINLSYEQQKAEICGMADFAEKQYGRRPVLFRPPGGPYTQATRQAAAACGMKAIVDWESKANAGGMDYQVGAALRPGEIVLMHFRPEFPADLAAFVKAQKAAGLKVVLLEDYLGVK